MLMHIFHET